MEITQILAFAVIAVELILILISLYLYTEHRLRIFYFLSWGFATLLLAAAIPVFIAGAGVLTGVLYIAAALFFLTSVLTAV